jgi:thiamine pyrophosphate-dependent acetolactate synthase large subunit-like protein
MLAELKQHSHRYLPLIAIVGQPSSTANETGSETQIRTLFEHNVGDATYILKDPQETLYICEYVLHLSQSRRNVACLVIPETVQRQSISAQPVRYPKLAPVPEHSTQADNAIITAHLSKHS